MADSQADYYLIHRTPGESHFRLDLHQVDLVHADYGSGSYTGSGSVLLPFRRDLRDFATHLRVGDRSAPSRQASLAILADALATTDAGADATGDARAAKGYERFHQAVVSRLPRSRTQTRLSRAAVLDAVARLGI